mgnify:CR=1 FL=1
MSQDTNIPNLVINRLTKAQYEGTTPSDTELYFVTDEDAYIASNQGSENAGKVLTVGSDGSVSPQDSVSVTDYTNLINKPQINGKVLADNKTASELGFATVSTSGSYTDLKDKPTFATVATSGSYNDLANKPTIPAAQQQVDWNSTTGITSIANKPTLATVATSGAYSDLSGTPTLSTVATSGDYTDLSNKPTINDLTTTEQQAALNSGATSTNITQITTNKTDISTINGKIPSAATTSNQLADKAFVNSSISNMAANYVTSDANGDNFATKAALLSGPYYYKGQAYTLTNNDYALVESDETKANATTRYMYDGTQWNFQYIVNSAPFTQEQLDAINSTITSNLVSSYSGHIADTDIHVTAAQKTAWTAKQDALVSGTNIKTINNTSLLGSGNITISGGGSSLPDMTDQSGKYLTNNGSAASWSTIDNAVVTYTLPNPDDPQGAPVTYNQPLATIITNIKMSTDFTLEDRVTDLEDKVAPMQPTVIDFWVDSTTGAITCTFSALPANKVVHTIIGNTTISGTWNNDYVTTQVFTPTTASDILSNPNGFVVSISGFLQVNDGE